MARFDQDWQDRYHCRPRLVETFVDRTAFIGRTFAAANWQRPGTRSGRGRLGANIPGTRRKEIWGTPMIPYASGPGGWVGH